MLLSQLVLFDFVEVIKFFYVKTKINIDNLKRTEKHSELNVWIITTSKVKRENIFTSQR